MVKNGKVKIKGLPVITIKGSELPSSSDLKALCITRSGRRVTVSMTYAVERETLPPTRASVGVRGRETPAQASAGRDMGITDRMVLSSGLKMMAGGEDPALEPYPAASLEPAETLTSELPSFSIEGQGVVPGVPAIPRRRIDRKAIANKQRRLSRCKKGSREWRKRAAILANAQGREKIRNRNECHRITTAIVRQYGHIAVDSLKIKNMTRSAAGTLEKPGKNVAAKSGLNREILTQTWGLIRQQLAYKAEWAGRRFVEVDPRNTSITCNSCGVVDGDSRRDKVFKCVACGFTLDADLNAARNTLRKSLAGGNTPPPAIEPV